MHVGKTWHQPQTNELLLIRIYCRSSFDCNGLGLLHIKRNPLRQTLRVGFVVVRFYFYIRSSFACNGLGMLHIKHTPLRENLRVNYVFVTPYFYTRPNDRFVFPF